MVLIGENANESFECEIKRLSGEEVENLKESKVFTFEWDKEKNREVFALTLRDKEEILGLVSITDYKEEFRIHINLLEASIKHRGKKKKLRTIPGCLIGFTCKTAFRKGYGGFVSLIPKTHLISCYQEHYGFVRMGMHLATFGINSKALMIKYLTDEEI
jgi:hypothetical protein